MFAKRAKPTPPQPPPDADAGQTVAPVPDPRDAAIERLERELAEQRSAAQALRQALDAAAFKAEVLEKSYAKQLADTRERLSAAERSVADKAAVLAALDGGHEDALRALNDARAEIKLLTAERDQLRKQIAQGGFRERGQPPTRRPLTTEVHDAADAGGTINQLIASGDWAAKRPAGVPAGLASATVAEQDGARVDMLAPELVFTNEKDDDER